MTTIAAWKDRKQVWMAGDSGAFDDDTVIISAEPKVWKTQDSLIGVSGSFRMMDLLRSNNISNPYKIRDFLVSKANDVGFPNDGWGVLVADHTGIYEIGSDFGVVKSRENYGATGAGAQGALAALYALEKVKDISPQHRVEWAVGATIAHSTNARPPVKVISL